MCVILLIRKCFTKLNVVMIIRSRKFPVNMSKTKGLSIHLHNQQIISTTQGTSSWLFPVRYIFTISPRCPRPSLATYDLSSIISLAFSVNVMVHQASAYDLHYNNRWYVGLRETCISGNITQMRISAFSP